jgi:Xaa-Pro aminopeptidase
MARRVVEALPGAVAADDLINVPAAVKTDDEIAHAREATRIAELGYRHLLEIARPGVSEDELAVELKWHSKTLGAEDNFLLLCARAHNRAVAPSTGRRLQEGDIVLAEITPTHIRRRGHGLGFAAITPGDVGLDNDTVLAPGMVFMIHPNQYLPETGYLLCGEPVVMTPQGAQPLTRDYAALAEITV